MVYQKLHDIISELLGNSKNGVTDDGQTQFNCPRCSSEKNLDGGDGKFNLEINFRKGKLNCWACGNTHGTQGNIIRFLKKYAEPDLIKKFKDEKINIYNQMLYTLHDRGKLNEWLYDDLELDLPDSFTPLLVSENSYFKDKALNYLRCRGINDFLIEKYNIGFTGNKSNPFYFNKRIIIPSYDQYGGLNYWVGRDFTGNTKNKYVNPQTEKTRIIFNENLVNWDDNITLVEGPFDHIVTPNSIPLLGKVLTRNSYLFKTLQEKCNANVNIFLDGDAYNATVKLFALLNTDNLYGRVNFIPCPKDLDPAKIFELYGPKGLCSFLRTKNKIHEYETIKIK